MNISKFIKIFVASFAMVFVSISSVAAQECSWLPEFLCNLVATDDAVSVIETRIRAAFFIAVGIIILVAVAYGLLNAYKYIKSGGGDGMEEANKGNQAILYGIGSIFVIVLGIAAVLIFFGANFMDVFLSPACIGAPDGAGCQACQNRNNATLNPGTGTASDLCTRCNNNPNSAECIVKVP